MRAIKFVGFWCVAMAYIFWHTLKKRDWHMLYADFEVGTNPNGSVKRRRLMAKRSCRGLDLYWEDPWGMVRKKW